MKQLIGYVSPETAYVVPDYPYGFTLRTQIRYWVETKPKFGQRFVSQTLNPKTGKWNKPKAGNYFQAVVLLVNQDEASPEFGYVSYAALSTYSSNEEIAEFLGQYQTDQLAYKDLEEIIKVRTIVGNIFAKRTVG